jgi:hypothetical protein
VINLLSNSHFEVPMSGRRSHPRFVVVNPWEGAVRVLRAVIVDRTGENELMAVSHAPGIVGEELSLDLLGAGVSLTLKVRVLESCPMIVNGSVRHRIRLAMPSGSADEAMPQSSGAQVAVDTAAEPI